MFPRWTFHAHPSCLKEVPAFAVLSYLLNKQHEALWLKRKGVRHLELYVSPKNAVAKKTWERPGFTPFLENRVLRF